MVAGDKLFVKAETSLWVSDGTEAGTSQLFSKRVGVSAAAGGKFFFYSDNEVWVSDGTEVGTEMLVEQPPPQYFSPEMRALGNTLFFVWGERLRLNEDPSATGIELWKSDGTVEGTVIVKDISRAAPNDRFAPSSVPYDLTEVNGELYFQLGNPFIWVPGDRGTNIERFQKTDGTEEGTVPLAVENQWVGEELFSFADEPFLRTKEGIRRLDETEFFTPPNTEAVFDAGDEFYFTVAVENEFELWRSEGTAQSTTRLLTGLIAKDVSTFDEILSVGGFSRFAFHEDETGSTFWKLSGFENNRVLNKEVESSSDPSSLSVVNNTLYFSANDGTSQVAQLWKVDDQEVGARKVSALRDPALDEPNDAGDPDWRLPITFDSNLEGFIEFEGNMLFDHEYDLNPRRWEIEEYLSRYVDLWTSDGTKEGTRIFEGRWDHARNAQVLQYGTKIGESTFAKRGCYLDILTGDQTSVLPNVFFSSSTPPWPPGCVTSDPVAFQDQAFFVGYSNDDYTPGLWRTDGTLEGTSLVLDRINAVANLDNKLILNRNGHKDKIKSLFVSDGTSGGTDLLGHFEGIGSEMVAMGEHLYFVAAATSRTLPRTGMELWRTDGTPEGTVLVSDVNRGTDGSSPSELFAFGDQVLFTADDGLHGREIWITDGTTEGTRLYADVRAGAASSHATEFTQFNDAIYFSADDGIRGRQLWTMNVPQTNDRLIGDIDGDQEVGFSDFLILSNNFGSQVAGGLSDGDLNEDDTVTFADFLILSANFGAKS